MNTHLYLQVSPKKFFVVLSRLLPKFPVLVFVLLKLSMLHFLLFLLLMLRSPGFCLGIFPFPFSLLVAVEKIKKNSQVAPTATHHLSSVYTLNNTAPFDADDSRVPSCL